MSKHIDALPLYITEAEFISKFCMWNEGTSTSPSGLHLGHYKALVLCQDGDPSTDKGKAAEKQWREIVHAHVAMINYDLRCSYSF